MGTSDIEKNKAFCVAPWLHAHVGADGDRRLCCISAKAPVPYSKLPWSEFKNSPYMKNIRQQMLNKQVPAECTACESPNRKNVYRDHLNQQYRNEIPEILKNTMPDGSTAQKIKFLDYRSNLCNMKCRTCSPATSSTYHSLLLKNFDDDKRRLFGDLDLISPKAVLDHYKSVYAAEALQLAASDPIDQIYLAGGEPLLEPSHSLLLKKLVDEKKAGEILLVCNTNLSYPLRVLEDWLSLASKFKSTLLLVSLDGIGDVGEYIRNGLDMNVFDKNLDYLLQHKPPQMELVLDFTLTSLNLFFLKEFADYVVSKGLKTQAKLMVRGAESFPLLRCETIPPAIKTFLLNQWGQFFSELPEADRHLLNGLNDAVQVFKASPFNNFWGFADGIERLKIYESLYPESKTFYSLLKRSPIGALWCEVLEKI